MHSIALLTFLALVGCSQGWFGGNSQTWDGLRVTWNLNPFSSYAFTPMPRTTNEAAGKSFYFKDDYCQGDTKFRGLRYWYNNDPATILLFDKAGYIAGIQTSFPKDKLTPSAFTAGHPVIEDGDFYTLTAYFVDPNIICTTGRTADQFNSQGTGDRLVIQNGTNALTSGINIPLTVAEVSSTQWTKGKCFWTMGLHYWYNVRKDMPCGDFTPFFIMYNKDKLNSFGFALNADLESKRYEHPTAAVTEKFMDPVPDCFFTDPTFVKLSTMHVYMTDSPRSTCFC